MLKTLIKPVLLAAFLMGSLAAYSQPGSGKIWSLQECIDHAVKNNLQVMQTQNNTEISRINLNQARAARLPNLNGNASHGYNYGTSIDPLTNVFQTQQIRANNFSLSSSINLFSGLQTHNNIAQSKIALEADQMDAQRSQNDIILNVVTAYMQILFADELQQTSQLQLNSTQEQASRVQLLFKAGSVAESNVLEVNSQLATDELAIINAQNQKDIATLNLVQLLNLPDATGFQIEKPDLPEPDQQTIGFSPGQVYETAEQLMPEIKSADLRVKSAMKGVDVSKGAYYPRLSFGASIFTGYSSARSLFTAGSTLQPMPLGFSDPNGTQPVIIYAPATISSPYVFDRQLRDNLGRSLNFNLSIPIFNAFQVRSNVQRSEVAVKTARLNTEIVRNQLRQAIQQAYADAQAAQKKYGAAKKQLTAMEQTFRNAEVRFASGIMNATDFNVAKNNFNRAQSEIIQAKYDYTFKLKILDFYQGKPLTF